MAMEIYLVGGAVRDQLLNRPVTERDWVVVGATMEQMRALGYQQVGKDFPVFLHPVTHEEYALARTEKKIAKGYKGFEFAFAPNVTLHEDLARRDLTINAIAQAADGTLIDPYGGQQDLTNKILRHVSPAFVEDPLRVLRVARFAARYAHLGFSVADETLRLMHQIVLQQELLALTPERIWKELQRVLDEATPAVFFKILRQVGALKEVWPEFDSLFGTAQSRVLRTITDSGEQALASLTQAVSWGLPNVVRFSVLLLDLSQEAVKSACQRLKVPNDYVDLASLANRHQQRFVEAKQLNAEQMVDLFEVADAYRRSERFQQFLQICSAHYAAEQNNQNYQLLWQAYQRTLAINMQDIVKDGMTGMEIKKALRSARVRKIQS